MNWFDLIDCLRRLKEIGVSKDEVLDVLEFDSDQHPDHEVLKRAREEVYK